LSGEGAIDDLIEHLNIDAHAAPVASADPIDWPTWAALFQRHVLSHVALMVEQESQRLGRKDVARSVASDNEKLFGRLTLFPLAKLRYALDDAQYADAMKDVIGLMRQHPELLTSGSWMMASEKRNGRVPTGVVPQSVWFTTLVPEGTAFDASERVFTYWSTNHLTLPLLHAVRLVAPYTRYLLEEEMRWRYRSPQVPPPLDEYSREAGVLVEYDAEILGDLLKSAEKDPARYVPLANRLCDLQVNRCATLGYYLADHDRDDEAARVYQHWVDADRDAVGVSNGADWLVTYYDTHGQHVRAVALADRMAEVFSYQGLRVKARVLERMGNYREAEAILKKASERYGRTAELTTLYVRWAKAVDDPGVKSAGETLLAHVFPDGIERVDTSAFAGRPADGVRVTVTGARGEKAGFEVDDVIVAVDGIAVHNYEQFDMAWRMDAAPEISFLTWKAGKYTEIRAPIRDSWRSGYFVSYRSPLSTRKP
jgi:hypothetical protein